MGIVQTVALIGILAWIVVDFKFVKGGAHGEVCSEPSRLGA
jgi:hypothetical protein